MKAAAELSSEAITDHDAAADDSGAFLPTPNLRAQPAPQASNTPWQQQLMTRLINARDGLGNPGENPTPWVGSDPCTFHQRHNTS